MHVLLIFCILTLYTYKGLHNWKYQQSWTQILDMTNSRSQMLHISGIDKLTQLGIKKNSLVLDDKV